ncbi:MAG: ATP-grasp domain-containing protein [Planctomycetota bacterium]|nr:ATP-grasp domain-containing protein [Planctomycetota bacterium]
MNVVYLSPGFPAEMPLFVRGLAQVGANVFGVGDQPPQALPAEARDAMTDYLQVGSFDDEAGVCDEIRAWLRGKQVDRVECMWERLMYLAATLRESFGVPGMTRAQTAVVRDKESMKQAVEDAGLRVPRHGRARTAVEAWEVVERVGYPAIVKPIDGAGSQDTYRCDDREEFARALELTRHVAELSVEEFIEGEELTYDTVCADGAVLFENVAWYRPKPMVLAQNPWISMENIVLRDLSDDFPRPGVELGRGVLAALGFTTGFTHMEWFRTAEGEAVFGEIGGRPPGARLVHAMNYSADIDLFRGWAEATCFGRLSQDTTKTFNASMVFKRAQGDGVVREHRGLDALLRRYGDHVASIELTPLGEPRRDWRKVVVGDGWIVIRHPDLQQCLEISARFVSDLTVVAE